MHHLPLARKIKGQYTKYDHVIYFASLFTWPPKREPEGREHSRIVSLSVHTTRKFFIRSESFLGIVVSTLDPVPLKDDPGPNYKSIIFCDILAIFSCIPQKLFISGPGTEYVIPICIWKEKHVVSLLAPPGGLSGVVVRVLASNL